MHRSAWNRKQQPCTTTILTSTTLNLSTSRNHTLVFWTNQTPVSTIISFWKYFRFWTKCRAGAAIVTVRNGRELLWGRIARSVTVQEPCRFCAFSRETQALLLSWNWIDIQCDNISVFSWEFFRIHDPKANFVTGCSRKGQCERRNDIFTEACLQDLIISVPRIIFGGHRRGAEEQTHCMQRTRESLSTWRSTFHLLHASCRRRSSCVSTDLRHISTDPIILTTLALPVCMNFFFYTVNRGICCRLFCFLPPLLPTPWIPGCSHHV